MKQAVSVLLLILGPMGCCGRPFHLFTESNVNLETPHGMTTRIINESAPVSNGGPIIEMPLGPCASEKGAKVAVVDVDGILMNADLTGPSSLGENPVGLFREKLDAIAATPGVKAVVLRINSPGGGVTASDIMWRDLLVFRDRTHLPIVACLMDLGTGGAYYLATAADLIVAHPTSITGGIGALFNAYNLQDAMGYFNIRYQAVKAGANIDMGSFAGPLTPEVRKLLQGMADEFHQRFRQVVEQRRPEVDRTLASNFDGRVFTAGDALERRLIDRIGYLDDAVAAARQLAHLDCASRVVFFHRCDDPARSLYAQTPNVPVQGSGLLPLSVPGLDRSRLPTFLYLWQPEVTLEKLGGK